MKLMPKVIDQLLITFHWKYTNKNGNYSADQKT